MLRQAEVGSVEQVECLPAELKAAAFPEVAEGAAQAEVYVR